MSEDPDWANLNPDDSQNSNFYYNQSQQQFSLSPVYKKEDLPLILNSIKSRCNYINFDYLKNIEQFKDVLNNNEIGPPKELSHYADESLFMNLMDKELQKSVNRQDNSSISSKKVNVKRKNPLNANFFEKIQKQGFEKSFSEESSDKEEELTFKDLKNFNLQKANKYRLNPDSPLKSLDFDKITDEASLLQYFFEIYYQEKIVFDCLQKDLSDFYCKIYIDNEFLVEFNGLSERRCKRNVSQLLLAYFCPPILKAFHNRNNQNLRKKLKTTEFKLDYSNSKYDDNFMNLDYDFNNVLKLNASKPQFFVGENNEEKKSDSSFSNSEVGPNYKVMARKKLNEEELRESLDLVFNKRNFTFSNFLSEMKTEIMKDSGYKDRKLVEKTTMKACLNCLENLFKYYKLVKKQTKKEDVLIFSHCQAGEFKVSIMEIKENGEKKPISLGMNVFKSLAMYFALKSFFEIHVEGSFNSINGVYRNLQINDSTYDNKKEIIEIKDKPLDMISQNLLDEIENYSQVISLNKISK